MMKASAHRVAVRWRDMVPVGPGAGVGELMVSVPTVGLTWGGEWQQGHSPATCCGICGVAGRMGKRGFQTSVQGPAAFLTNR